MMLVDQEYVAINALSKKFGRHEPELRRAYNSLPRNARVVLRRQEYFAIYPNSACPVCRFVELESFLRSLCKTTLEKALFTLARLYDEVHIALCTALSNKPNRRQYAKLTTDRRISLRGLGQTLQKRPDSIDDNILLKPCDNGDAHYEAIFEKVAVMSFTDLEELKSLNDVLPGESHRSGREEYVGIGGGGGSDIISASIIGVLLAAQDGKKKRMDLLVSTRTWATGSQGKKGAKIGTKREVEGHDGAVTLKENGKEIKVGGTYRIKPETSAEGRHLESIPLKIESPHHSQVFMILDQSDSKDVPEQERATLPTQIQATLSQAAQRQALTSHDTVMVVDGGGSVWNRFDTVISVDTGGDVFGKDSTGGTTPDQDYRVQHAVVEMNKALEGENKHNLVTAVVAPGVDAPADAPKKAKAAGGMRYCPKPNERQIILDLLKEYQMDGTNTQRFGKTTLALQASLNKVTGWTSLDLPEYVVDTWDNPWNSFVYIRECMSEIILMPTEKLLPLIRPT